VINRVFDGECGTPLSVGSISRIDRLPLSIRQPPRSFIDEVKVSITLSPEPDGGSIRYNATSAEKAGKLWEAGDQFRESVKSLQFRVRTRVEFGMVSSSLETERQSDNGEASVAEAGDPLKERSTSVSAAQVEEQLRRLEAKTKNPYTPETEHGAA